MNPVKYVSSTGHVLVSRQLTNPNRPIHVAMLLANSIVTKLVMCVTEYMSLRHEIDDRRVNYPLVLLAGDLNDLTDIIPRSPPGLNNWTWFEFF